MACYFFIMMDAMGKKLEQKEQRLAALKTKFHETAQRGDKVVLYNTLSHMKYDLYSLIPSNGRNTWLTLGGTVMGVGVALSSLALQESLTPLACQLTAGTGLVGMMTSMWCGLNSAWSGKDYIPKSCRAFEKERQEFLQEVASKQKGLIDHVMDMAAFPGFEALVESDSTVRKAFEKAYHADQMKKAIEAAKASQPEVLTGHKKLTL